MRELIIDSFGLVKAGALIIAEIERLDRLAAAPTPPSQGGR